MAQLGELSGDASSHAVKPAGLWETRSSAAELGVGAVDGRRRGHGPRRAHAATRSPSLAGANDTVPSVVALVRFAPAEG